MQRQAVAPAAGGEMAVATTMLQKLKQEIEQIKQKQQQMELTRNELKRSVSGMENQRADMMNSLTRIAVEFGAISSVNVEMNSYAHRASAASARLGRKNEVERKLHHEHQSLIDGLRMGAAQLLADSGPRTIFLAECDATSKLLNERACAVFEELESASANAGAELEAQAAAVTILDTQVHKADAASQATGDKATQLDQHIEQLTATTTELTQRLEAAVSADRVEADELAFQRSESDKINAELSQILREDHAQEAAVGELSVNVAVRKDCLIESAEALKCVLVDAEAKSKAADANAGRARLAFERRTRGMQDVADEEDSINAALQRERERADRMSEINDKVTSAHQGFESNDVKLTLVGLSSRNTTALLEEEAMKKMQLQREHKLALHYAATKLQKAASSFMYSPEYVAAADRARAVTTATTSAMAAAATVLDTQPVDSVTSLGAALHAFSTSSSVKSVYASSGIVSPAELVHVAAFVSSAASSAFVQLGVAVLQEARSATEEWTARSAAATSRISQCVSERNAQLQAAGSVALKAKQTQELAVEPASARLRASVQEWADEQESVKQEMMDLDKAFQSKLATASNNRARKVDEVNTETETYIRQMMEQEIEISALKQEEFALKDAEHTISLSATAAEEAAMRASAVAAASASFASSASSRPSRPLIAVYENDRKRRATLSLDRGSTASEGRASQSSSRDGSPARLLAPLVRTKSDVVSVLRVSTEAGAAGGITDAAKKVHFDQRGGMMNRSFSIATTQQQLQDFSFSNEDEDDDDMPVPMATGSSKRALSILSQPHQRNSTGKPAPTAHAGSSFATPAAPRSAPTSDWSFTSDSLAAKSYKQLQQQEIARPVQTNAKAAAVPQQRPSGTTSRGPPMKKSASGPSAPSSSVHNAAPAAVKAAATKRKSTGEGPSVQQGAQKPSAPAPSRSAPAPSRSAPAPSRGALRQPIQDDNMSIASSSNGMFDGMFSDRFV